MGRQSRLAGVHVRLSWKGCAAILCAAAFVALCAWGGCRAYRRSHPSAETTLIADSLNTRAFQLRYTFPDSTLLLAQQAESLSATYPDGLSEALNHQLFVCFLRMDYDGCKALYERIRRTTANQIELLVSEVNMMMASHRAAQNRAFFDYYNRAAERVRRIEEEQDEVEGRNKERLDYALTELSLATAANHLSLMQEQDAERELLDIDTEGYLQRDKEMLAYYYYLNGVTCTNRLEQGQARLTEAFDYFFLACSCTGLTESPYLSALIECALSDFLSHTDGYELIRAQRPMELGRLYRRVAEGEETDDDGQDAPRLYTALATKAIDDAKRCGILPLTADGYRAWGNALFSQGEYDAALACFDTALNCLNTHHFTYYPNDKQRLVVYAESSTDTPVDMQWAMDSDVQTVPECLTHIRERLSATYSALDEKQKSDYNRNIYLDLMDYTRQDKSLESRAALLSHNNGMLHALLGAIILSSILFCFFLFLYARKWKLRSTKLHALLKDMSEWFMEVAFAKAEDGLDRAFDAYPRMKKEKRILQEILQPYIKWTERNRSLSVKLDEERTQLIEEYRQSEKQIAIDKRKNISRRAKVSLVHSITPFIDRILYATRRMECDNRYDNDTLTYISELADEINRYNDVLAEWIRLNQGEMELSVESFPVQELFDLLEKGQYNFKRKGIDFRVEHTDTRVKADRALTFFMLSTLADNARKFTPSGGRVTVSATALADAVEVSVTDTGCGLTKEETALVSSSNCYDTSRIGALNPEARAKKGSGFGLLNCKGIIEKYKKTGEFFHVCDFRVESEEGKGSRFSFRLPKGMARMLICLLFTHLATQAVFGAPTEESTSAQEAAPDEAALHRAVLYADSVYFANVQGDYEAGMRYADSTFLYLSECYQDVLPDECTARALTSTGDGMQELEWLSFGVKADYFMIMGIRNEMAVAALALHEWDCYEYNNNQFTRLYKLLTNDSSLEEFYANQRTIQTNLSVSLAVLVFLLAAFFILVYIVYFRRRMLFRFNAIQVLETNHAVLGVMRQGQSPHPDTLIPEALSVVLTHLKELHETSGVLLALFHKEHDHCGIFSAGEKMADKALSVSLLDRAFKTGAPMYDKMSNTQAYPLLLRTNGEERICFGAVAFCYGTYRMQREDFAFENFIVNHLAILIYESVIQRGQDMEDVETAENEKRRSLYERSRIKVQNQILDNCLSTIKHESMYYPNRIKQITLHMSQGGDNLKDSIHSLNELATYYKEVYSLLCAQADRQIDSAHFKCEPLSPTLTAQNWQESTERWNARKGYGIRLSCADLPNEDTRVCADSTLLPYLLETLSKEWMDRIAATANEEAHCLTLQMTDNGAFVRFALTTPARIYGTDEAEDLFRPDVAHYSYLLCKEMVREHDKLNNYCGCRIRIDVSESESKVWFTLPKYH